MDWRWDGGLQRWMDGLKRWINRVRTDKKVSHNVGQRTSLYVATEVRLWPDPSAIRMHSIVSTASAIAMCFSCV